MISFQIKAIPIQKTILAVNNFVVTTTIFLNNFSMSCEEKFMKISSRITDLETVLLIFEAKLNSVCLDDNPAAMLNVKEEKVSSECVTNENQNFGGVISIEDYDRNKSGYSGESWDTSNYGSEAFITTNHFEPPSYPPPPPPPPPPILQQSISTTLSHPQLTVIIDDSTSSGEKMKIKDHPDYAMYFKMMKVIDSPRD